MNILEKDILSICKDFIEVVDRLYKNGEITHKKYIQMTKLKLEYINKVEYISKID